MLTHGAMRGCGLTSLMVCINDTLRDIRERNVTIRSEIWTTNICPLGFQDIRECMTLWGLILQSLGCRSKLMEHKKILSNHDSMVSAASYPQVHISVVCESFGCDVKNIALFWVLLVSTANQVLLLNCNRSTCHWFFADFGSTASAHVKVLVTN